MPIDDAASLCGSLVEFLAMTTNVISPGCTIFKPFSLGSCSHPGGTMLETLTKLHICMPASLRANSKDWSCSLCLPTPFVRKKYLGIMWCRKYGLQNAFIRLLFQKVVLSRKDETAS